MAICAGCGKEIDETLEMCLFEDEVGISQIDILFDRTYCHECAEDAYNRGDYRLSCNTCWNFFDPYDDDIEFDNECGDYGLVNTSRSDMSTSPICAKCALEKARERYERDREEHPENYNDDTNGIPVDEAALIWASNGKDEDYMFGYTEEELEDAL